MYSDVGVKKAPTLVFVGETKITAHNANDDISDGNDITALAVLRIINRSVLTVKVPYDSPGTEAGMTMITYVHIGI